MKKISITFLMLAVALIISGCDDNAVYVNSYPATPQGLTSITGDGYVELLWYPVETDDIDHYNIYWAPGTSDPSDVDSYYYMTEVSAANLSYTDYDVENGTTYYYSITAVNENDYESYLSDYAMDTPRPDGYDVRIYDYHYTDLRDSSGYDLYYQERLDYSDDNCDIYLDYDSSDEIFYLTVRFDEYLIQDMGYAASFDNIGYAPEIGWSSFSGLEAIVGHIYLLRLYHSGAWHYAKIWVTELSSGDRSMEFSWAYQLDPGNRELKVVPGSFVPKNEAIAANNK